MTFDEVIGQEEAKQRLKQMHTNGKLPHAMMLCGPKGCGKMALAMAFACYLLDSSDKQKAMLAKMEHPDLHFTFPTIKLPSMGTDHKPVSDDFIREWRRMIIRNPYFTMDKWMAEIGAENQQAIITAGESDCLTRKLSLKSSQGGYKVSVIWLPERMNIECANKLLKLIEEPPRQTVFIMVCEEPSKLLETIRSRTQRIDIKKIDNDSIEQALVSKRGISQEAAKRIARLANGNWQKAVEELQADSENELFLDTVGKLTVVFHRLKGFLVSAKTDMSNLSGGEKNVNSVYHTKASAENGNDNNGVVLNHILSTFLKGRFNTALNRGNSLS